jgi:hypothetical protein
MREGEMENGRLEKRRKAEKEIEKGKKIKQVRKNKREK